MDTQSKRAHWSQQVEAFERSGSSRRAWCAVQGVRVGTLDYWRYRLRSTTKAVPKSGPQSMVPVLVLSGEPEATTGRTVTLVLPSGLRLTTTVGADATWLAQLLREIGAC